MEVKLNAVQGLISFSHILFVLKEISVMISQQNRIFLFWHQK
jgi:hypothetical protein